VQPLHEAYSNLFAQGSDASEEPEIDPASISPARITTVFEEGRPLTSRKTPVLQAQNEHVEDIRMLLSNLVQKDHEIGAASYELYKLAALY
jgi:hypothetical protein